MTGATGTLSRKQSQARTRQALLNSAQRLIAADGLERTSIDAIADDAGFTKGAFYANFDSKQALFLALLESHFDAEAERLDALLRPDADPVALARETGLDFVRRLRSDPSWQSLYFQFAVYATRDEEFRSELVVRYERLVDRLAAIFARVADANGIDSAVDFHELAEMNFFIADGFLLHRMLDGRIADDLYGRMVATLFTGAISGEAPAQRPR